MHLSLSGLWTYTTGWDITGNIETHGLRVGCIEQRHELIPQNQIWCRSALNWAMNLSDLPRRERE